MWNTCSRATNIISRIKKFTKVCDSSMSNLPLSTSDVKHEVAIRKGDGDFYNLPAMTVMECFDATVKKYGDKPALNQKVPSKVRVFVWMSDSHLTAMAFSFRCHRNCASITLLINLIATPTGRQDGRYSIHDLDVERIPCSGRRLCQVTHLAWL